MPDRHRGSPWLRLVRQQENAECGIACLAMIANSLGRDIPLADLRDRFRHHGRGTRLDELVRVAAEIGLMPRPVRAKLGELPSLRTPAILHWERNHFVVLQRVARRGATLFDPARGRRRVSRDELGAGFTGVAVEFTPAADFRRGGKAAELTFAAFAGSFRGIWRYLSIVLILLIASQLLALVPAVATQILIDGISLGGDRSWLYRLLGGVLLITVLSVFLDAMRGWMALCTATRVASDSTASVVHHLFSLPATFVARRHLGDIVSRLDSLTPLRNAMTEQFVAAVVQSGVLVVTVIVMFLYSPLLAVIATGGAAVSSLAVISALPGMQRFSEEALICQAREKSSLIESLRGFETLKALDLSEARLCHWRQSFIAATEARFAAGRIAVQRNAATGAIAGVEQVAFLGAGINGVLDQDVTLGVLFAFMALRGRLSTAVRSMHLACERFALLRVHTGRLSDVVLAEPECPTETGGVRRPMAGSIEVRHLAFGYPPASPLFTDLSFSVAAGAHVVVTGPSGCGKTTLLQVIAGQLAAERGHILFDGIEAQIWSGRSLREQIALVRQNECLFRGTLAENVSGFAGVPDLGAVRAACIVAGVWQDILAMPLQLDTAIGDTGVALSGGQVQRIALARALYRNPRILLLDEATSHLDVETEHEVLGRLSRHDLTIVSVAHRPDAIRAAQFVVELASTGR